MPAGGGALAEEQPKPPTKGTGVGVGIVAALLLTAALYFGREFFLPIAFAFTLNALFRPVVRGMRLPAPAGAAVIVLGMIALIVVGGVLLARPVKEWLAKAPERFEAAQQKLDRIRRPVQQVQAVAERIQHAADGPTTAPSSQPSSQPGETASSRSTSTEQPQPVAPQAPAPQGPGLVGRFIGTTTTLVGGVVEVLVLLYLLLASDDMFFRKLLKVMPRRQEKREAREVVDEAESVVLRYVAVTALINAAQAVVIGLALWWLKVPNPVLWALLTFVLEFIPYLGATIMIAMLAVVSFGSFDGTWHILAAPGIYLLVTTVQNNIVSPYAYGDRLKLNPVAVLIGVLLWWFIWGIGGAFLAVPIIATVKIVCSHSETFGWLAEFLGE